MTKKCLITGGCGALGRTLARTLLSGGYNVRVLDTLNETAPDERVEYLKGDVRFPADTDRACDGINIIFHLASAPPGVDAELIRDVNINGAANMLDSADLAGVDTFILASCCSVYGAAPGAMPCAEDAPLHSSGPFSLSKIIAEEICFEALEKTGMKVAAIRIPSIIGPGFERDPVVKWILGRASGGSPVFLPGGGKIRRHYVDAADCARALLLAAEKDEANGLCFNVGYVRPHTDEQAARAIIRSLRSFSVIAPVPMPIAEFALRFLKDDLEEMFPGELGGGIFSESWYDTTRAREILGWTPEKTLSVSIHEYIKWRRRKLLKSNP